MIRAEMFLGTNDEEMQKAFAIRHEVFCKEQNVPEDLEYDGQDTHAIHVLVHHKETPAATGRLLVMTGEASLKFTLGRIAVLSQYRGQRLGDLVVRVLIRTAYDMGGEQQWASVQVPAIGFYEKLGFKPTSEVYEDAGIPHVTMVHEGDVYGTCKDSKPNN